MNNQELAKKITDDLFGDAKQLRQFTDFPPNGHYLSGWGKSGMITRIEHLLAEADSIPRRTVAEALAALREDLDRESDPDFPDYRSGINEAIRQLDATIAKLGLGAAKETNDQS